jgi:sugar phosphate isomerase/epimerase
MGYDGVEWRVHDQCHIAPKEIVTKAKEVHRVSAENHLEICNLATYLHVKEAEHIKRVMEGAQIMGAPACRVGVPAYNRTRNYNEIFSETLTDLGVVEKLAEKYGVKALIEIHFGNIAPSAALAHRLVSNFNPRYVGVIFDPGNMIYEGMENWRLGLELLGPWLAHVHVKNTSWDIAETLADGTTKWRPSAATLQGGIVDWGEVVQDLKAVGYTGYLSSEDFSRADSTEEKILNGLRYLKGLEAKK